MVGLVDLVAAKIRPNMLKLGNRDFEASRFGSEKYPVIRNDETIDFYLERYLDERVPEVRVEVINAAITSFYSHHHLIYLNQTILKFDPDMTIFLDGFNDYYMYEQADFDQFRDYAYQERVHTFMNEPSFDAWLRYTGWWLFRKSHFAHVAGRAARKVVDNIGFGEGGSRKHIEVETALENLNAMPRVTSSRWWSETA